MTKKVGLNWHKIQLLSFHSLWILTPTASPRIINGFKGEITSELGKGVYLCGDFFRMGIVVIHHLLFSY